MVNNNTRRGRGRRSEKGRGDLTSERSEVDGVRRSILYKIKNPTIKEGGFKLLTIKDNLT